MEQQARAQGLSEQSNALRTIIEIREEIEFYMNDEGGFDENGEHHDDSEGENFEEIRLGLHHCNQEDRKKFYEKTDDTVNSGFE